MSQNIDFEIILKHIRNEATEEEIVLLNHWLNKHRSHRNYYNNVLNYYAKGSQFANSPAELKRALRNIYRKTGTSFIYPKTAVITLTSLAASLFLLIFIQFFKPSTSETVVITNPQLQAIVPGSYKALLILEDGTEHALTKGNNSIIASDGTEIKNTGNQLEYLSNRVKTGEMKYNILKVPRGGEYFLILSDSTKVWLNSETTLRYPVQFAGSLRQVELSGEAYFEVSKNDAQPFVVSSGDQLIKVFGTQFNVSSYADNQKIYTTLVEGKVEISLASDPEVKLMLKPSEQSILNTQNSQVQKRSVDVNQYVAWKEGRFVFYDQPLDEIMNTLSKWYDVQNVFSNVESKKLKFTGNLERYSDFEDILDKIEKTNEVNFTIENKIITIR